MGGTIGSAVFMMPAVMAPYGGIGLLSLAFATLGALAVALTFGALARRVTGTGGSYAYTRAALGDFAAFLIAWTNWINTWVTGAALAIGFVAYLGVIVPGIVSHPVAGALSGLALIWAVVAINVAGVRESGIVSLATTILKLTPLLLVSIVGLWFIERDNLPAMHPGEGNALFVFASVFALSFWNFIGIDTATGPSEDTVDPTRTIPRALLFGTLTVGAVYFLVSFVAMGVIPANTLAASASPLADVGTRVFGRIGSGLIVIGALVSTAGAFSATILWGGQMTMAAGRDRIFPSSLARLSRRGTPWISYVLLGLFASVLLLLNFSRGLVAAYQFILLIATLTAVIPYAFSAVASLIFGMRDPQGSRTTNWHEMLVAVVAFAVCFWVIATSGMETVYWVFLLVILGLPIYVMAARQSLKKSDAPVRAGDTAPASSFDVAD